MSQTTDNYIQNTSTYLQGSEHEKLPPLNISTLIREDDALLGNLPNTPLLRLAAERGWRIVYYDDDGSGAVEIVPGAFLEVSNHNHGDGTSDSWSFSVGFCASRPPLDVDELAVTLPDILMKASQCILDASDEEVAEV